MPSTSEVAVYHARDTTATPAEGCVCCCTSPCASLCVLLCCVTRLSSLQHCSIPEDRPPQSYKDCIQQLPTICMDRSEAFGKHICSQIREMRCISTWSHDSHVTNSGACVGHWYTLRYRLICTEHAFVWPHYLLVFVVSVVCTAHTCSVCTCTTCVHISVPSKVCACVSVCGCHHCILPLPLPLLCLSYPPPASHCLPCCGTLSTGSNGAFFHVGNVTWLE